MRYDRFDPPAFLNDFTSAAQVSAWNIEVAGYFTTGIQFNNGLSGVSSQFYDPTQTETDDPFEEALIDWPGFPKIVRSQFPGQPLQAWKKVDEAPNGRVQFQDEYLEWHVARNAAGQITRVSFSCETTQYFRFLSVTDQNKLLEIYKLLVNPAQAADVKLSDLFVGGNYNPRNKWNTTHGAVHLIQPNNNLFAEVQIAAQACILRKRNDGTPITDSTELINCSQYGEAGRASDPKIGAIVNDKARQGYSVSLRNPVALYLTRWTTSGNWRKPDGSPVGDYWRLLRGRPAPTAADPAMGLHLVYEVPASEGFVVGDIKVGNRTIQFAGEIAEQINVGLFALLCREGNAHNPSFRCGVFPPGVAAAPGIAATADAVASGNILRSTRMSE
jgi:hypothetical protein